MQILKARKAKSEKKREADLTSYISPEKERDVKQQIDKLIESTKNEFMKYESYSRNRPGISSANYGPTSNSNSAISQVAGHVASLPGSKAVLLQAINQPGADRVQSGIQSIPQSQLTNFQDYDYTKKAGIPLDVVVGNAAASIAREIGASCVISIERKSCPSAEMTEKQDDNYFTVQVSIFKKANNGYERVEYRTKMRKVMSGSIVPVKELLMEAINRKYIKKGDRVVCVEDESLGMGYKALLLIFDVDKIFFNISTLNLAEHIIPEVIESAINLGLELGKEGREGRKVGTAFIIGPSNELKKYTKQMIMNPFSGYPEEMRNISDPGMKETIKNFAQLDGVFIIDDKGIITTAGAYLNVDANCVELPQGYGTRHRCSAAITKVCDCIAVVISESGGTMSIFKQGKLVMRLP